MKSFSALPFTFLAIFFDEIVFTIVLKFYGLAMPFLFSILISTIIYCLISLLPKKINKIIFALILFAICFFFCMQLCLYKMFGFFFDFGTLAMANQLTAFVRETIDLILENIVYIVIFYLPFILYCIFFKKINFTKIESFKVTFILMIFLCVLFVVAPKEEESIESSIRRNGVLYTLIDDTKNKEESELIAEDIAPIEIVEETIETEEVFVPEAQILNIDFNAAVSNNGTIQKLNDYFASVSPTYTNEYTGMFEDKNLVLILGESFNRIGIKKDLTPTLYKLENEGFYFSNYYSPSYNSTVGGEFQLLNSAYAKSDILGIWKAGTNSFPFSLANTFRNKGYSVFAYHDNAYDYMDRNSYLKGYGFDNYTGCGNGLEKKMACNMWPESDEGMMLGTMDDWINEDKFFAYYVTVSGHGPYTFDRNRSDIGYKYADVVKEHGYNYSEKLTAYYSSMIEVDKMMEALIDRLTKEGKLEDTVIVLVGDHYPYYLEAGEYGELFGPGYDLKYESNRNSLIIYNFGSEKATSDKVCATMDVAPTIHNLFGNSYDSRLLPGKDIFSNYPGMIFFGDGSWISDYGMYSGQTGFVANEDIEISDETLSNLRKIANTRMSLTVDIFSSNYYGYIERFIEQ